jgi:hypothetical protein
MEAQTSRRALLSPRAVPAAGAKAYFDFSDPLPHELFWDDRHADFEGSQILTRTLVEELANLRG